MYELYEYVRIRSSPNQPPAAYRVSMCAVLPVVTITTTYGQSGRDSDEMTGFFETKRL